MSEFSESYHIRTTAPKAVLGRLRQAGFAGLAFPPANGWLTFVPFPTCRALGRFAQAGQPLSAVAEEPVLEYQFAEDHGWSLVLYRPGHPLSRLAQAWDPEPAADTSEFDIDGLVEMVADPAAANAIRGLLATVPAPDVALRFAEALGLPAYRWLSPAYAQNDPDSFKAQGARQVGSRPKDPLAGIVCPPVREVVFPRPDLSACEALELFNGVMGKSHADWFPAEIFCQGGPPILNAEGRLTHGGSWCVKYRQAEGPAVIRASVTPASGNRLVFMADRIDFIGNRPMPEAHVDRRPPVALPADMADSPEIMAAAMVFPVPDDLGPASTTMIHLGRPWTEMTHWEVNRWWRHRHNPHERVAELAQAVDVHSARLLGSTFRRFDGRDVVGMPADFGGEDDRLKDDPPVDPFADWTE